MDIINSYFKKKADKITFLEVKDNSSIGLKGYPHDKKIPLPLRTETLIKEIKDGNLKEEINISYVIDGIVYLIGIDPSFPNIENYKDILLAYNDKIEDYIFYEGIRSVENNEYSHGAICFRALKQINPRNTDNLFNYALVLEEIAKKYFEMDMEEEALAFLKNSTNELEMILDADEKYSLAYYKLGYHYKYFGNYLKAKLAWNKFLNFDMDELRLHEIRGEIDEIEDNVTIETGLTYLSKELYNDALTTFLKLLPKFENWWELRYFIASSYKGLGDLDKAIEYYYGALELNDMELEIYNELGICLFSIEDIQKSVEIFSQGIEKVGEDYKLLFNRGLGYLQLGDLKKAYKDIDKASQINPDDENIIGQKLYLDKLLENTN
ncbi:MAG: tetratricopeptide repeat protein [Tissierellaceae bacterium]|nr:tetratricopeptide repeat protein [Tissierellaceae bacterium]